MCSRKTFNKYAILHAVLFIVIVAAPSVASASLSLEYYSYGGFGDIVSAFNKCALIYSSDAYKTLLPTIWIVSMAVGLVSAHIYKLQVAVKDEGVAVSRPEGVYSVLINSLLSVILFSGLIVPKGTLHIYDPTENAYQAVGGIPIITVVAAGATNLLERSIISLVETSGDPLGYSKQSGSKGVQVLNSLAGGVVIGPQSDANGSGLGASIYKYAQDCVLFELARPGTTLTVGKLEEGSGAGTTFTSSFSAAASNANFTVVYDPAIDVAGSPVTCSEAWTSINKRLSGSSATDSFAKIKKEACDAGGYRVYDTDGATATTAYNECVTSTDALIKSIDSSGAFNLNNFIVQMYSVYVFKTVLAADSPSLFAGNAMSQRSASQLQSYLANMPQIRGTITSVLVAILPFVSLLFLTKYWQKALAFLVGAFAFTTIWGIGNAVVNDFYVSASVARWAGVFAGGMGITPFDVFAQSAVERMNVWGLYQVATFTVATSISTMLFGAVGSIAASMAGAGMHTATGDASKGRSGVDAMNREMSLSPAQRAATAMNMASGYGLASAMANHGNIMAGYEAQSQLGNWNAKAETFRAGMTQQAAEGAQLQSDVNGVASGNSIRNTGGPQQAANVASFGKEVDIRNMAQRMENSGGNAVTESDWNSAQMKAERAVFKTSENYQRFQEAHHGKAAGQMAGDLKEYSAAVSSGFNGSWQDYHALRSEVQAAGDFNKSKELNSYAAKQGISLNTLLGQIAAGDVGAAGGKAKAQGHGLGLRAMETNEARALYRDLQAGGQPVDPKQAIQGLQQNLASGNLQAIQQDRSQSAAFESLTGKQVADVAKMDQGQRQQVMQQAQQTLQPPVQQTSEQRAAVQRAEQAAVQAGGQPVDPKQAIQGLQQNLASGNLQAIQQDTAQAAAFRELTGGKQVADVAKMDQEQRQQVMQQAQQTLQPPVQQTSEQRAAVQRAEQAAMQAGETAQYARLAEKYHIAGGADKVKGIHENLKNTPESPDRESTFVRSATNENMGLKVNAADVARDRAEKTSTITAQDEIGRAGGKQEAADVRGQDVEQMMSQLQFHSDLAGGAKADMKEKMAEVFKTEGQSNPEALMSQFGREQGAASMVLDAKSARVLNQKLGGNAHFQKGDVVSFGMGQDGGIKFANASRGGFALDKSGHTTQRMANTEVNNEYAARSGSSVKTGDVYENKATVVNEKWGGEAGGFEFKSAVLEERGGVRVITGTPVGGGTQMTLTQAWDSQDKKWKTSATVQSGGTKYSGDGIAKELDSGNTTTLKHAMGGNDQEKRDYAAKVAEETKKLGEVQYAQSKGYTSTAGLAASKFSFSSEYTKRQAMAVNQMAVQTRNIMESSGTPEIAAQRIQGLRSEFNKAALNDFKSMNFGDKSSKPMGFPSPAEAKKQGTGVGAGIGAQLK